LKATYFFGAIEIDGFIDKTNSKSRSTNGFESFAAPTRSRHPRPGPPGDPERAAEAIRSKEAVPLLKRDATQKSPSKITLWCFIPSDP